MTPKTPYPLSTWIVWALLVPTGLVLATVLGILLFDVDLPTLDNPHLWWIMFAVPIAGLLSLWAAARKRRSLAALVSTRLAPLLAPTISANRQAIRACVFVMALAFIGVAIIGPRWGTYVENREAYGVDVVVALDVSRSMLARDLRPNRLSSAKQQIRQQLTERSVFDRSNRLGLLAFAGSTSMKVPLTLDHPFFRESLEKIEIGSAPRGGTAIAETIYAAADFFAASPEQATKIILVFTDGEDHEGDPAKAAKEVYDEFGISTFTIGVGDPRLSAGAEVPVSNAPGAKAMTHDGQIVFSKLDDAGLRQIAEAGNGRYAALTDLPRLVDAISAMQREHLTTEQRTRSIPRYQWFLAVALALLTLEALISERRRGATDEATRLWQEDSSA